jgi:hypothetical protein
MAFAKVIQAFDIVFPLISIDLILYSSFSKFIL